MGRGLKKLCREVAKLAGEIEKDLRTRQPETASQAAGLYMFAKGCKSFQASRLLFSEGFWQDAASIGRTLLELGFQARWLNQNPERAGRLFLRHELRDRLKLLRGLKSSASPEIRIKAVAFLEKLNSGSDFDRSWRNWWSKESNVEKLAKEMDLSPTYDLLYRPLCWFVHSSPFANAYYLREKGEHIVFDCRPDRPSPKDSGFAEMLFSSAPIGFLDVLAAVDTVFVLGRQSEFDRVGVILKNYHQELSEMTENRRKASHRAATI
ncbi:MAG TPA: DUF5677 domain-containing protein [Candidatus Binataceae bacterium]|nr:DUF5677 domain-containing protein [Candidatus Binataceae bacterium]